MSALKPSGVFTGDMGSGGSKGAVPAPVAGDGAAGKVLGAGGDWVLPTVQNASVASISLLATVNIPAFAVVLANGNLADSSNLAHRGHVVGIALAAIAAGFVGQVASSLEVTNPDWAWLRGDVLYLNGTGLSTTPPASGFLQQIAVAQATTKVVVELGPAILI